MNATQRQARDKKAQARWEARQKAKWSAQEADPAWQAAKAAEGTRDARHDYDRGHEPDRVWTRQDPYACAWREETTRIMRELLWAE